MFGLYQYRKVLKMGLIEENLYTRTIFLSIKMEIDNKLQSACVFGLKYLFVWTNLSNRWLSFHFFYFTFQFRVIHLFPWSGLLNERSELSDTFRVPCLKEKRMVRLLSQLSQKEEEMFRNMVRRLNLLVQVSSSRTKIVYVDVRLYSVLIKMIINHTTDRQRSRCTYNDRRRTDILPTGNLSFNLGTNAEIQQR